MLLRELKKSGLIYTSEIVQTRKAFESALESFKPDIILSDYSLPSFDGLTAFNIKQNTFPDIPFIIVSGVIGEENAVELIRNGVTDYALKDKLFVLIPKIHRALKEAKEKKEKRIADEELVFQNEEKEKRAAELIIVNEELNKSAELLYENLKEISDYKYALDESTIIAITDSKGIIKKVNSNFCKISKYSEEELIGQDHRIINSGYHTKEFIRDLWVTIANGKIWKGELKNKAKDGTFYWVDTTIVPFLDEQGKPYQYLAIRVDITDRKEAEENLIQRTAQLGTANKELAFQNDEKEKRAAELIIANKLASQNEEIEKRSEELILANKELKKAEQAIKESEEKYRSLIEQASDAIFINNNTYGKFLDVNERACTMLGYTKEQLCTMKPSDLFTADELSQKPIMQKELLRGERTSVERNILRSNGSLIPVEITAKMLSDGRTVGIVRDISERKQVEQAIKESEEKYRTLVEQASDAIFITDTAGRFITVNTSACKLSQYSEKELLKMTIYDLAVTEDLQKNPFHFDELKQGKTVINERVINRNNGTLLNVEVTSKLLSDGRLLVFVRDISERKKTETAIRESEEKFRTLVQQAADGIFIVDQEGNYLEANESAAKLTGYSIDELKKMNASELIPTEELKKNPLKLEVIKKRGPVFIERVIRRKDKTLINVEVSAKLMDNGKVIVILRDISERIKAQIEIIKEKNLSDSIINSLPGIFYLYNMEGKFLRWNKNLETESKYSAEEIREMHPLDFFDEDEKELLSRKIKNVFISGEETVQANFLLKTKEKIPYYFTGIAISYEGVPCLMGVGIDFSELKKIQQALAENENHLRVILQTSPECIKLTGINGELEEMNPAGLAMIEADSFEQIIGKSLFDVIDKPYRKAFSQLTQNVFKGKSGRLEFEITGLKGTHCWLETHAVPLKDAEGKVISLLGITRDITERKKTEKEILRVIERYDMIAQATSDTIWDWDITNDKILYNEGIINMFGYKKTEIENIADWWKTKIHPDDLQIFLEAVAAAFKKQSYNLQLEYRFRCADGSFKYIYDRAFVIYDEHKKPCKIIGAMQDVSKLKENEISLKELNKNLQKQAKELSISNEELKQFAINRKKYIKAIENQNKKLQDIAWTQSHIVRAPLARMMGIVSIIRDLKIITSAEHEEWIKNFEDSANELDSIIHDIVNKIESKDIKLDEF